jgi:hypothetical protein
MAKNRLPAAGIFSRRDNPVKKIPIHPGKPELNGINRVNADERN